MKNTLKSIYTWYKEDKVFSLFVLMVNITFISLILMNIDNIRYVFARNLWQEFRSLFIKELQYFQTMIKAIILSLSLIVTVSFANDQNEHQNLSYEALVSLLQTIHNDAIVLGNGGKTVYVFIDPLCPHSRKFITMVSKNPTMLSKYQYHLHQ